MSGFTIVQKPVFDSMIDKGNLFFDFKTGDNKFKWLSVENGVLGICFGQQ